ncbi:MAG: hypothetical protein JSV03_04500 [Planctomycetota bacterium]|nr:MAG: hypothetical protein JSV03_04500 [Planctomycetota bacterium]
MWLSVVKQRGIIGLAGLIVILVSGQVFAQSTLTYTLGLGGDNHRTEWKAGTPAMFTPGNSDDNQEFAPGSVITWDVRVAASGSQQGAANIVFHLELHQGSADGPRASGATFYSSINDGTGTDPTAAAAFAVSYDVYGSAYPGRIIDCPNANGPCLKVHTYPTYNAAEAELLGMGAGYKQWCVSCGATDTTAAGIGIVGELGEVPVFEGQIDLGSLPEGTYVLKLNTQNVSGINVLRDDVYLGDNQDAFATAVGTVTNDGDTITFDIIQDRDWGDAPDPTYKTLAASNGPAHILGGPWLGDATDNPDAEMDGQQSVGAVDDDNNGSDDEDGVNIPQLKEGVPIDITFEVNGPAGPYQVDGWIDFNGNGTFDHPSEQVVNGMYTVGVKTVPVTAPVGSAANSPTYARFRINSAGPLLPEGEANDGEVEDHYPVEIIVPQPIQMVSAVSKSYHGYVFAEMSLNLPLDSAQTASDSRVGGPMAAGPWRFLLTFDQQIVVTDGTIELGDEIVLSPALAGSVFIVNGNQIDIQLSPFVPNQTCLSITVSGLESDTSGSLEGDTDVHVRALYGDALDDGIVNIHDLGRIKSEFNQTVTNNNCDCDVNADNVINIDDLSQAKGELFESVTCP